MRLAGVSEVFSSFYSADGKFFLLRIIAQMELTWDNHLQTNVPRWEMGQLWHPVHLICIIQNIRETIDWLADSYGVPRPTGDTKIS